MTAREVQGVASTGFALIEPDILHPNGNATVTFPTVPVRARADDGWTPGPVAYTEGGTVTLSVTWREEGSAGRSEACVYEHTYPGPLDGLNAADLGAV